MKESTRKQLDRGVGKRWGVVPAAQSSPLALGFGENQVGPGLAAWGTGGTSWAQVLWLKLAAARLRVSHISQSPGRLAPLH